MSIPNSYNIISVIEQELDISNELLNNENFNELNIMGNRIMENCLFSNDYRLFLYGFFIKELALTYQKVFSSTEPKAFQSSKVFGVDLIDSLKKNLTNEINEEFLWEKFHLFNVKMREYLREDFEKKFYKENIEYSKFVVNSLMNFLFENEDVVYMKFNQLFSGIINILDRIFRAHSGYLEFTLINSYLKMLDRYYDYLLVRYYDGEKIDKENLKKEISKYIKFICQEGKKDNIDITEYDKNLWEIIKNWRVYYIHYHQPVTPVSGRPGLQKRIELPEETKKVIEESLKEAIEKKL